MFAYIVDPQWRSVKCILNKSPLSPMNDDIDSGVIQTDYSADESLS